VGIALGLGILVGVRAALTGSAFWLLPLTVLLLGLAAFNDGWPRRLLACAACGCMIGGLAGAWRAPESPPPLTDLSQREFHARVRDDPEAAAAGWMVRVGWHDSAGYQRESLALLPAAPQLVRGERATLIGELVDGGDVLLVEALRVEQQAGWLARRRVAVRGYITKVVRDRAPGSPGALALGLLIGDDSGLPQSERESLRRAGLSHITAVSGWNVNVVVATLGAILLAFSLRGWPWMAVQLAALAGYVWLVGVEPPILRAALMGAAALVALQLGRPAHGLTLLTLAAAVMAMLSPAALSSLSFQLSVLAMLGLLAVARVSGDMASLGRIVFIPVAASVATGLLTAPLLAWRFGAISLTTVPANLVAAPLVPFATWSGIVLVLVGRVPVLGAVLGTLTWVVCGLVLKTADLFASLPGSYMQVADLSASSLVLIYLALALVLLPFVPEGRAMLRALGRWYERGPAHASVTMATLTLVLLLAVLVL
jgi:competence protein ComEC